MQRLNPELKAGRVYRTEDFARWAKNPAALAERLVADGVLERLDHGLFHRPRNSPLGPLPPESEELLRAFLRGRRFIFSGPPFWNAFHLGPTGQFAQPLVYNTARSGKLTVAGREYTFRRVRFPNPATPEWYLVDLLNNLKLMDADPSLVLSRLKEQLDTGVVDRLRFEDTTERYANRTTKKLLRERGLYPEKQPKYPKREHRDA